MKWKKIIWGWKAEMSSTKWYKKFAKFRDEENDPDKRDVDTTRDILQERKLLQHILYRQWRKINENVSKYSREKN